MSNQLYQPFAFPQCNGFPPNPRPGTTVMVNGMLFVFLEQSANVFKWVPYMHAASYYEHSQSNPDIVWVAHHNFVQVTNAIVFVDNEVQTVPIVMGVDGTGPFVRAEFDEPTVGTMVITGHTAGSRSVDYIEAVGPGNLMLNDGATVSVNVNLSKAFPYLGSDFTYSLEGAPDGLTFNPANGYVTGTLDASASAAVSGGIYPLVLIADNGKGDRREQHFTWTVQNTAPVTVDDVLSVVLGQPADVSAENGMLANDNDEDGDVLTLIAARALGTESYMDVSEDGVTISGSQGGIFTIYPDGSYRFDDNGQFTNIAPGSSGQTAIEYRVVDTDGVEEVGTLTVYVANPSVEPTELTLNWEPYTMPPETTDDYWSPGEDYGISSPSFAMNEDSSMLIVTNAWQWMGEHKGTSGAPLFKMKQRDGDAWTEVPVFFPEVDLPRIYFDNHSVNISPNGRWIMVTGGDADYRAAAMLFEMVDGVATYRQYVVLDISTSLVPEDDNYVPLAEYGPTRDWVKYPVETAQAKLDAGEFQPGDYFLVDSFTGSLNYGPDLTADVYYRTRVVVMERIDAGNYRLFISSDDFTASEQGAICDTHFAIGHIQKAWPDDVGIYRNGIWALNSETNQWEFAQTIENGRADVSTAYGRSSSAKRFTPDGQQLFIHNGDVVGMNEGIDGEVSNICRYIHDGTEYVLTDKLSVTTDIESAVGVSSLSEMGWAFDISHDGTQVAALTATGYVTLWHFDGTWTLKCVTHASDTTNRATVNSSQAVVNSPYEMTTPLPAPVMPVDYIYNSYFENPIGMSADGAMVIVSAYDRDYSCGTALIMGVDENYKLGYQRMTTDLFSKTEAELQDIPYNSENICCAGATADNFATYITDYDYITNGTSIIRYKG